jgi:hypothetical protein
MPRPVRQFAETERFGVCHATLGALICRGVGVLRKIEPAILFHHEPYQLKARNADLHQLASIVSQASNMASSRPRA